MKTVRWAFLMVAVTAATLIGCRDREPEPEPSAPPRTEAETPAPVAAITGWPAGLGRALVLRLAQPDAAYRLVVPELGDRRFADSAIAMKMSDSIAVALLARRGKIGEAQLRVLDSEAGAGSCVTWPSAHIQSARYGRRGAVPWRIAAELDSVTSVPVDSLAGMRALDSLNLVSAVHAVVTAVPPAGDSALLGIPYSIRSAYSFRVAGVATVAAELTRTSSSEADPREERLFVIGERNGGEGTAYRLAYSRRSTGRADSTAVTDLLVAVVSRQSRRAVAALGVEDGTGVRLNLLERVGRRRWRTSWSSVVPFC